MTLSSFSMTFPWLSMTFAIFHDFQGLENGLPKFHDIMTFYDQVAPWCKVVSQSDVSSFHSQSRLHAGLAALQVTAGWRRVVTTTKLRLRFDCKSTALRAFDDLRYDRTGTAVYTNKRLSVMTVADVSAGTDVLRHCDLNDPSRTAVERSSNRSRIV